MTPDLDALKAQIGIDGLELRLSDNGEYLWATMPNREHYSFSRRIPLDPQPHDVAKLQADIAKWNEDLDGKE